MVFLYKCNEEAEQYEAKVGYEYGYLYRASACL